MTQQPKTVSELWPSKWLKAADLPEAGRVATITGQRIELLRSFKSQGKEPKLILSFKNATKELIATKTQAEALADLTGSEAFAAWPGTKVLLRPKRLPTGKFTIEVCPPPADNGQPEPTAGETLKEFFGQAEPEPEIEF